MAPRKPADTRDWSPDRMAHLSGVDWAAVKAEALTDVVVDRTRGVRVVAGIMVHASTAVTRAATDAVRATTQGAVTLVGEALEAFGTGGYPPLDDSTSSDRAVNSIHPKGIEEGGFFRISSAENNAPVAPYWRDYRGSRS